MKFIRKLFFFLVAILLIWMGIVTYNKLTDGFSIHQIASSQPPCPQYNVDLSPEKKEYLQTIFDQKFYYLGKGCQFYVFESEDGRYVVKFFKQKHLRSFAWLKTLPLPEKLRDLGDAKIARRAERADRLFSSCYLAYEKMAEETGLIFIHLNRIPAVEKKVTIVDKLGCKHTIKIDDYEFFVQKKGIPLKDVFSHIEAKEVPSIVQKLANLVLARCEKGIRDLDKAVVQNIAFTEDGEAIFTDIGQFYADVTILQQEEQTKDLKRRLDSLRIWAETNQPEFAKLIFQVL